MAEKKYTDVGNNPKDVPVNEITKALNGADFPADKNQLVNRARDNNAPDTVVEAIRNLPGDRFEGMPSVVSAYGEQT